MRNLLIIIAIIATAALGIVGCGSVGSGELVGVDRKIWYTPNPYGMLFVPPGTYQMGPSDQDVPNAMTAQSKTVTVQGFWMDETEITNSEYRQFVNWVRDSMALTVLGRDKPDLDFGTLDQKNKLVAENFILDVGDVGPGVETLLEEIYPDEPFRLEVTDENKFIFLDWRAPIDYQNIEIQAILIKNTIPVTQNGRKTKDKFASHSLYLAPPAEVYHFTRQFDLNTDALYYEYFKTDLQQAAQKRSFREDAGVLDETAKRTFNRKGDHGLRIGRHFNPENGNYEGSINDYENLKGEEDNYDFDRRQVKNYDVKNDQGKRGGRYSFLMHKRVHIYPDTLCWISDFTYSFNEPMTKMYFWHPAYDYYPVVGVSWTQAEAFCMWRSMLKNAYQKTTGDYYLNEYRLPTESEWEYAARGGLDLSMYPWGGLYTRNYSGCFIANFKPMRGNYYDDGGVQTLMVGTFDPNEWGLYDMAGNVAEWTSNAFDESAYSFTHDLNPDYQYNAHPDDMPAKKRKVVRGGSWKDVAYYMQNGSRTYEYQDTAKSYIGFRCVRTYLGRHRVDGTSYSQVY